MPRKKVSKKNLRNYPEYARFDSEEQAWQEVLAKVKPESKEEKDELHREFLMLFEKQDMDPQDIADMMIKHYKKKGK